MFTDHLVDVAAVQRVSRGYKGCYYVDVVNGVMWSRVLVCCSRACVQVVGWYSTDGNRCLFTSLDSRDDSNTRYFLQYSAATSNFCSVVTSASVEHRN